MTAQQTKSVFIKSELYRGFIISRYRVGQRKVEFRVANVKSLESGITDKQSEDALYAHTGAGDTQKSCLEFIKSGIDFYLSKNWIKPKSTHYIFNKNDEPINPLKVSSEYFTHLQVGETSRPEVTAYS